jgi:hypothetical protein
MTAITGEAQRAVVLPAFLLALLLSGCGGKNSDLKMVQEGCLRGGGSTQVCDCAISRMRSGSVKWNSREQLVREADRSIRHCLAESFGY